MELGLSTSIRGRLELWVIVRRANRLWTVWLERWLDWRPFHMLCQIIVSKLYRYVISPHSLDPASQIWPHNLCQYLVPMEIITWSWSLWFARWEKSNVDTNLTMSLKRSIVYAAPSRPYFCSPNFLQSSGTFGRNRIVKWCSPNESGIKNEERKGQPVEVIIWNWENLRGLVDAILEWQYFGGIHHSRRETWSWR
jgi:hypothetical protein